MVAKLKRKELEVKTLCDCISASPSPANVAIGLRKGGKPAVHRVILRTDIRIGSRNLLASCLYNASRYILPRARLTIVASLPSRFLYKRNWGAPRKGGEERQAIVVMGSILRQLLSGLAAPEFFMYLLSCSPLNLSEPDQYSKVPLQQGKNAYSLACPHCSLLLTIWNEACMLATYLKM
ncbi:hypothetical protein AB6A40_005005 [Gnathostoma spinigerum]|uniref:Uncharacterized protein n=1 Tax=Gnathostoma spinigerum TaxID=75299 RepID=A0ABD6ELJ9_9BILA